MNYRASLAFGTIAVMAAVAWLTPHVYVYFKYPFLNREIYSMFQIFDAPQMVNDHVEIGERWDFICLFRSYSGPGTNWPSDLIDTQIDFTDMKILPYQHIISHDDDALLVFVNSLNNEAYAFRIDYEKIQDVRYDEICFSANRATYILSLKENSFSQEYLELYIFDSEIVREDEGEDL